MSRKVTIETLKAELERADADVQRAAKRHKEIRNREQLLCKEAYRTSLIAKNLHDAIERITRGLDAEALQEAADVPD